MPRQITYLDATGNPVPTPPIDGYLDEQGQLVGPPVAASQAPAPPAPATPSGGLSGFLTEATKSLDPRNIHAALNAAFWHPIDTATGMLTAQDMVRVEAMDAFQQGDYVTGTRKLMNWMVPFLGPRVDEAGDYLQQGDVSRGLGATVDVGLNIAGPKIVGAVKSLPIVPRMGSPVADAVRFGLREGIPVDVATATSNPFLRGAQRATEESMLGSTLVSPKARTAQADALTATGERLAGRTSPTAVTAEQAGQAVRDRVTAQAASYNAAADTAYSQLRALEAAQAARIKQTGGLQAPATSARPFTNVPLAVDIAPTKAAMRPIYDALKRESELVPLMGDKARALTALDRLMQAPDLAPLSVADSALGDLKALARVDQTFRRTAGQGIAAEAVKNLDAAVTGTARRWGPDAFKALMDGRAATVNKFKTIEILDKLHQEPVGVFNQLTFRKDAGIGQLRALAKVAPDQLRQVGRAWLENALGKATAEGGFGRAQGLFADWQNLGPQTRQLLFGDAAHVKDLDHFFLLAKKMTENPNPSGSALTLFKAGELGALGREAFALSPGLGAAYTLSAPVVAKLLLSPTTTRLLLQGLRLPLNAKAARLVWAGQMEQALERARGGPALVPAVAHDQARPAAAPAR